MGDNSVLFLGTTSDVKKINFLTCQDVQIFVFIRPLKATCCIILGTICPKLEGFSVKIKGDKHNSG